ncbi:CLUMA_CG011246, isoform A, partial [Clunio marinus]
MFFHGPAEANYTQHYIKDSSQILSHRSFNKNRPTVLYISGWFMNPKSENSQFLIKAYLKRGDYNLLVLDWGDYSVGFYDAVMIRISIIARIIGESFTELFDNGLNTKTFHCVGHSFGAHACGIIGRELYRKSNQKHKLNRITGLDPAGPGFFPVASFEKPLNKNDAEFVDAIHSDVFFVGTKFTVGHVDFYPNFNMMQPACPSPSADSFFDFVNLMCSHLNAVRYFADSMKRGNGKLFPSRQCDSWEEFIEEKCRTNTLNYMGIQANPKAQ